MKKLVIIHYLPVEYYPPITNLLDYIGDEYPELARKTNVFTSKNIKGRIPYCHKEIKIKRYPFPIPQDLFIVRFLKYWIFNLVSFLSILAKRPDTILYYESSSAWSAWFYSRFINKTCRIFVHNHEYFSPEWYAKVPLSNYYHKLEQKWLYNKADWISQTNQNRMDLFHKDNPNLSFLSFKLMPNYPPIKWKELLQDKTRKQYPVKIVYVGSLAFQSSYIREFCLWVSNQKGNIIFDIYSYNLHNDVKDYLCNMSSPHINFYDKGIEYMEQPKILSQYDIGMILYNPMTLNYVYNAPNKLFEYLACGLDVWYSPKMLGIEPYKTENSFPKVLPIDFEDLDKFDWENAILRDNFELSEKNYFCENEYKRLITAILQNE